MPFGILFVHLTTTWWSKYPPYVPQVMMYPIGVTATAELLVILSSKINAVLVVPSGSHPVPPQLQSLLRSTAIRFLETSAYPIAPSFIFEPSMLFGFNFEYVTAFGAIFEFVTALVPMSELFTSPFLMS